MPKSSIRFRIVNAVQERSISNVTVYLEPVSWDDYGFKTTYRAWLAQPSAKILDLGTVKILEIGSDGGRPNIDDRFTSLSDGFCSLGQSFSYYEILHAQGRDIWDPFLRAMNDLVFDPLLKRTVEAVRGFNDSLIRSSGAARALEDAAPLFDKARTSASTDSDLDFEFRTTVGGAAFRLSLDFKAKGPLAARWAAVIGYNGTGKTKLLANLGMVASRHSEPSSEKEFKEKYGSFQTDYRFGSVIAVSHSAFDTFEVPRTTLAHGEAITNQEQEDAETAKLRRGYIYCGLRKSVTAQGVELKSSADLRQDFIDALEICRSRDSQKQLMHLFATLAEEPSLSGSGLLRKIRGRDDDDCADFFDGLSTGHKLAIKILTQLLAYCQRRSLILFDEPETHLHPSLTAALMKCFRILLDETDSFAVITTHSPVVLQETPSRQVRVIRRVGRTTQILPPSLETFGEDIGTLTAEAFHLNAYESDWHWQLKELANSLSLSEISALFERSLSLQARSYISSIQADKDK